MLRQGLSGYRMHTLQLYPPLAVSTRLVSLVTQCAPPPLPARVPLGWSVLWGVVMGAGTGECLTAKLRNQCFDAAG